MDKKKENTKYLLELNGTIQEQIVHLFADNQDLQETIENLFNVKIFARGNKFSIIGEDESIIQKIENILSQIATHIISGHKMSDQEISMAFHKLKTESNSSVNELYNEVIYTNTRGKSIHPYTDGQKEYIKAINENEITFGIGPAGTGKTYLAVAQAVAFLTKNKVSRIILVRPVVEAGESLGFLPGDMIDKVEPYLRPLYDSFYDLLPAEKFGRYLNKGIIELAPLAYMRGRTLNDSFIILDEAQNTTHEQMKMFLTRIGFGSRAVITGDITQIDLIGHRKKSGLIEVKQILNDVDGIKFVYLTTRDVVRHEIVQRIVRAYEEYDGEKEKNNI